MKKDDMNAVLNATMQLPDSARIALGRMADRSEHGVGNYDGR